MQTLKELFSISELCERENLDYRRVYLLNVAMAMTVVVLVFFSLANMILFLEFTLGIALMGGSVATLGVFLYFRRTRNVEASANGMVLLILVLLICYINLVEHQGYALMWVTILPAAAYYLLGRRKASLLIGCFGLYLAYFVGTRMWIWEPTIFDGKAVINLATVLLIHVALINYYELSRSEAQEALSQKNQELKRLSVTDTLTGLYNRAKLDEVLDAEILRSSRDHSPFAIIIGDVDRYKLVNDHFGHLVGDEVLKEMAKVITSSCRKIDTVGRWGGEEFLVIAPETNLEGAMIFADRIRMKVHDNLFQDVAELTISLGVAAYVPGDTPYTLVRRADEGLRSAKLAGRNRIRTVQS